VPHHATSNGADTPYNAARDPAMPRSCFGTFCAAAGVEGGLNRREASMFRWAVICLVISLIAGGLGLTGVSVFAKRPVADLLRAVFLGFLVLVGFAYLVSSAVVHSEVVPALVAISV